MNTRICSVCKIEKSLEDFHKDNNPKLQNKFRADCKDCNNKRRKKHTENHPAQGRIWRGSNKDKITGYNKKQRIRILKTDPEYDKKHYLRYKESINATSWKYRIKMKYGLSIEEYEKILEKQNYCCYICQRNASEIYRTKSRFCVDHDHKTGKIRGILCVGCNGRLLPSVRENVEIAYRLYEYLSREVNYGIVPSVIKKPKILVKSESEI